LIVRLALAGASNHCFAGVLNVYFVSGHSRRANRNFSIVSYLSGNLAASVDVLSLKAAPWKNWKII